MSLTAAHPPSGFDLSQSVRVALLATGCTLFAVTIFALARAALGFAPSSPYERDVALWVHLATVIPAIPLGLVVLVSRKGNARHKLLGKLWLMLMGTTAVATFFIRNVNDGTLSWIHLFSALTLIGIPKVINTARQHQFVAHRRHVLNLFVFALIVAGGFSFFPGRTMWQWTFG